jgi:hypothetical protein
LQDYLDTLLRDANGFVPTTRGIANAKARSCPCAIQVGHAKKSLTRVTPSLPDPSGEKSLPARRQIG